MRKERKKNDNNDKHMDKYKDVMNDCDISSNYLPSYFQDLARRNFLSGHNSAKVTYLCKFAVTIVSRVASTAVRANSIVAERVRVTNGW